MKEEDYSQIWKEICFHLTIKSEHSMTEARYAQKIKMALEKLGWSEYAGEIKEERPLHIGRGAR